jgi:hypothetical protein
MTGRFHDDMTLGEAREILRELLDAGHKCPCCTQMAKIYRRKITGRQAAALISLFRAAGRDYGHFPTVAPDHYEAAQAALLRYWGLTEELQEKREDGGRAGWWRVTERGEAWIRGQTTVPKYARTYDSRCLGLTGESVTVVDALGTKFNYNELMAGI